MNPVKIEMLAGACILLLLTGSGGARAAGPTQTEMNAATDDGANWIFVDHDYHGQRYAPLAQIRSKRPEPDAGVQLPLPGERAVADRADRLWRYALRHHGALYRRAERRHLKPVWTYRWNSRGYETLPTQRGAAIKDGKLLRGTADGYLLALDAKSGKLLWSRHIAESSDGYFISMPPLIYDDLVVIGPAGAEWAAKGWVAAFAQRRAAGVAVQHVPDLGDSGAESWGGEAKTLTHGGGNVWTPMSLDSRRACSTCRSAIPRRIFTAPTAPAIISTPTPSWRCRSAPASWHGTTR